MKLQEKLGLLFVAAIALFAGQFYYQTNQQKQYSETTLVYQQPRAINPFKLYDQNNNLVNNESIAGKWNLVFLGYLSCPDICPMTMAKLSRLLPELNEISPVPVQVLFVSVDPKRDSAEKRKQYVDYFNPDILGLGAEHVDLFPFVRNLGLMYSVPDNDAQDYFVDHSASVVLIDPNGNTAAIFKPEIKLGQVPTIDTAIITADFKTLIQ
ncbi:MAG: protein SCO1/2 [Psychrosphaera sp.]|jgi:protein SCO1/2|uniref:SCO family protein n=1 Tax=Psychrosphaera sp. F3M07 TaxID=2841560 RepID=UPI001C0958EE|nr:SCO family protein [Psychrosphaera sp. F3M07]MBU2919648.1 SCO family protein [Psychrosphaera sp. F3M07]